LDSGDRNSRIGSHDGDVRLRLGLRQGLKGHAMIWFTAAVTLFLFAYLLAALLRPEWF